MQKVLEGLFCFPAAGMVAISAMSCIVTPAAQTSKIDQCNQLTAITNQTLALAQQTNRAEGSFNFTKTTNLLETAAQDLQALNVSDQKLQGLQSRYIAIYQDLAADFKKLASLGPYGNPSDREALLKSAVALSSQEKLLVNEVNSYCKA